MAVNGFIWRSALVAIFLAAEIAMASITLLTLTVPASAQFFFDSPFFDFHPRRPRGYVPHPSQQQEEKPQDFSRAPAATPRKPDAPAPTTKILVLGDSMADWLAYGLEDTFADAPEFLVLRKHRAFSGLIRYENKNDAPDWAQVARQLIAAEKPQAVIMMIGIQDRQSIRDTEPAKDQKDPKKQGEESKKQDPKKQDSAKQQPAKPEAEKQDAVQDDEQQNIAAPERERTRASGGVYEYRSEEWEELYGKRIDDTIAAMRTANVPILWVGLPSIRGQRSTSDAQYLNELYRTRAEAAGIMYVDVWDGFVDEHGRFSSQGPDFEGQIRRLRTSDGVHFTKAGARKLGHYVERELRRVLNAMPVALTAPEQMPQHMPDAEPGKSAARPLAGPVYMLTVNTDESEELLGGQPSRNRPSPDPIAVSALVKGEPVAVAAGRADDFVWPPRAPNMQLSEPLPPTTAPIMMVKPAPPPAKPEPRVAQAPAAPAPPRVAGHHPPQGQAAQQGIFRWRAPPPAYFGPPRGFFGLFR